MLHLQVKIFKWRSCFVGGHNFTCYRSHHPADHRAFCCCLPFLYNLYLFSPIGHVFLFDPRTPKMSESMLKLASSETDGAVIPLTSTLMVLGYLGGKFPTPTCSYWPHPTGRTSLLHTCWCQSHKYLLFVDNKLPALYIYIVFTQQGSSQRYHIIQFETAKSY